MAKKVFYNRRYKMPGWLEPYALWAFLTLVTLAVVFFTSVERVSQEPAPALPAQPNAFAEGLFYELREAEGSGKYEVALRFAERLKKKYDFQLRETSSANCRSIELVRGSSVHYHVAAALQNGQTGGVFSVLVFLDRLAANLPAAQISASLFFPRKNCHLEEAIRAMPVEDKFAIFIEAENNATPHDPIPRLRNLNLRRFFPSAFLMPERTRWANILALTAEVNSDKIFHVPLSRAKDSLAEQLALNPLLRHPIQTDARAEEITKPVALYLSAQYQLHVGGFTAILLLIGLLALIPFTNALTAFRERIDLGSALTSTVLYAFAFGSYLLIYRLILQFTKSDFSAVVFAFLLIPAVFFPLRILQKTMLRAELNRPGLHLLVLLVLVSAVFFAPVISAIGFLQLTAASGYSRASLPRKLLRLVAVITPLALLFIAAREPMGNLVNFLQAFLPAFSVSSLAGLVAFCVVGGNLTALLFVPRERL